MTQEHGAETVGFSVKALGYGGREITTLHGKFTLQADHPHDHRRATIVWTPVDEDGSDGIMLDSLDEAMGYVRGFSAAMPAREGTGWQPIETAPKDGTVFDAWCSDHTGYTDAPKRIANCRYLDGVLEYRHSHGWFMLNKLEFSHARLTHWMPLPTPPEGV